MTCASARDCATSRILRWRSTHRGERSTTHWGPPSSPASIRSRIFPATVRAKSSLQISCTRSSASRIPGCSRRSSARWRTTSSASGRWPKPCASRQRRCHEMHSSTSTRIPSKACRCSTATASACASPASIRSSSTGSRCPSSRRCRPRQTASTRSRGSRRRTSRSTGTRSAAGPTCLPNTTPTVAWCSSAIRTTRAKPIRQRGRRATAKPVCSPMPDGRCHWHRASSSRSRRSRSRTGTSSCRAGSTPRPSARMRSTRQCR